MGRDDYLEIKGEEVGSRCAATAKASRTYMPLL